MTPPLHLATAVWGEPYRTLFLDYCLPSLFGGVHGALPAGSRFVAYTLAADADALRGAMRERVPAGIETDAVAVEGLSASHSKQRYRMMALCHQRALHDSQAARAAAVIVSPDCVIAAGGLDAILRRVGEGKRAMMVFGLRVAMESFLPEFTGRFPRGVAAPRDLVGLALRHLHPFSRSLFVDSDVFSGVAAAACWPVGSEGLVARCFHLHPIMIDVRGVDRIPSATIDGHFVAKVCRKLSDVHVVVDSDEFVAFELSPADRQVAPGTRRMRVRDFVAFAATRCDHAHRHFFESKIRIHAEEVSAAWRAAERRADRLMAEVVWLEPVALLLATYGAAADGIAARWRRLAARAVRALESGRARVSGNARRVGRVIRRRGLRMRDGARKSWLRAQRRRARRISRERPLRP